MVHIVGMAATTTTTKSDLVGTRLVGFAITVCLFSVPGTWFII